MRVLLKMTNILTLGCIALIITSFIFKEPRDNDIHVEGIALCYTPQGCVFKTIFGEDEISQGFIYNTPQQVVDAIESGLSWIITAQQSDGGWGAGSHYRQDIMDPHAVNSDPATTAMVSMALLRTGSTLDGGPYAAQLKKGLEFLLKEVEKTPKNRATITTETGTQIQTKLGVNIDAVLALQFFSNLISEMDENDPLATRVRAAMDSCVEKLEHIQRKDGSFSGDGWAGILQSALANNALESASANGGKVNRDALNKSREFQKGNFDSKSGNVNTTRGAGIVLYSVSGTVRASAAQARKVREDYKKAVKQGKLKEDANVSAENLEKIGYTKDEAMQFATSYEVYEASKSVAQDQEVMTGFGNNGGEEFLSYLQTGESLIINNDDSWKSWYENTSGMLINIQNRDGSWNGHHCITSPVFCTATALLTLSINNDFDQLVALGRDR